MHHIKYTRELLEPLVRDSLTVSEVVGKLGLRKAGGSIAHVKNRIIAYNLDMSHFLGHRSSRGRQYTGKSVPWQERLVLYPINARRVHGNLLTKALLESGRKYMCELCGNRGKWRGITLVLEVDHINNEWNDSRPENLRFLCPNCHAQETKNAGINKLPDKLCPDCKTVIHRQSNRCWPCGVKFRLTRRYNKNFSDWSATSESPRCAGCGIAVSNIGRQCRSCGQLTRSQFKINWPDATELQYEVASSSYVAVGRRLGVSDVAVKKHIKQYARLAQLAEATDLDSV